MTITLQAVNELIQSLESAGELSIREQKFLKLAKAYQQLAAENVALKDLARGWANATDGRLFEEFGEISHDSIDDCEAELKIICPATDRIVAEAEARGVEKDIAHLENKFSNIGVQIMNLQWLADSLREGSSE
ncbi:hypothetical protein NUBL17186_11980 [Klebsiella quasipneumoniae]|uniref:hypothetical protein n=1 Tax=Klebsiella quasipneumoniae TaxID=1463165 RepID=UPI002180F7E5|nr:hypothetical protein [Klebsiella quasipneumoniae]GKO80539.1 hypothetical protein NUBL17186_11980 [Klebsiella quasipneumoniae]HCI9061019.1 hypothetical protein [Klebsiella quasipneumoniae]